MYDPSQSVGENVPRKVKTFAAGAGDELEHRLQRLGDRAGVDGRQHDVAVDRRAKGLGCLDRRADLTEQNVTRVVAHGRGQGESEVAILHGNLEAPDRKSTRLNSSH